jgi:hypothetical protein
MGFVLVLSIGGLVLLVAASPVALRWVARHGKGWDVLGNVGQTYGGASAVLSGLALCGVAVSLILQRRQTQIAQLYSARQHQLNLARLALDHPESLIIDGAAVPTEPDTATMVIVNLWVANWATAWQLGALNEASLRSYGARLFQTELARRWWMAWGASYATSTQGKRFVQVLTEECNRQTRAATAPRDEAGSADGGPTNSTWCAPYVLAIAAAAALATAAAMSAWVRTRRRKIRNWPT